MTVQEKLYTYSTDELKAIIGKFTGSLVERRYYRIGRNGERSPDTDGNSEDVRRDSTPVEKSVLDNLMLSALYVIRQGGNADVVLSTVEYAADLMIEDLSGIELNGYLSIYNPLRKILKDASEN